MNLKCPVCLKYKSKNLLSRKESKNVINCAAISIDNKEYSWFLSTL